VIRKRKKQNWEKHDPEKATPSEKKTVFDEV